MRKNGLARYRPLRGVRVLAFEVVAALPAATRMLADLGAEVLRVVSPERGGSLVERLDNVHTNKSTVVVDLRLHEGRELAKRLATRADIVCSNFRPRVLPSYGLDYDSLRALKSDIIVLQLSGYGTPGPWQEFPAYGPSIEAAAGLNALLGEPDEPPQKLGSDVYADYVSGRFAVLALLGALDRRRRTGEGQYIDLSMYESLAHLLGDALLTAAATGEPIPRLGNRDAAIAPQGIYPCAGPDEWLAVSVATDDQWRALRDLIGHPCLTDPCLERLEERRRRHDAIDAGLADWTRRHDKETAARLLQARGIPAGPVAKASDVPFDPQHAHRGFFTMVRHTEPVAERAAHPHTTLPWIVEGSPRPELIEAPQGDREARRILKAWLGMTARDVRRLREAGALRDPAPPRGEWRTVVKGPGGPVDPDYAERLGLPAAEESPR
jgi:benzylsuccinate CoA-transferase BbsF subunit